MHFPDLRHLESELIRARLGYYANNNIKELSRLAVKFGFTESCWPAAITKDVTSRGVIGLPSSEITLNTWLAMLTVMGQALPPPAYASRNLYLLPGATVNVDNGGSGPSVPLNFWNRHVHGLMTDVYMWQMERTSMWPPYRRNLRCLFVIYPQLVSFDWCQKLSLYSNKLTAQIIRVRVFVAFWLRDKTPHVWVIVHPVT